MYMYRLPIRGVMGVVFKLTYMLRRMSMDTATIIDTAIIMDMVMGTPTLMSILI